jgi:hypothetical protein
MSARGQATADRSGPLICDPTAAGGLAGDRRHAAVPGGTARRSCAPGDEIQQGKLQNEGRDLANSPRILERRVKRRRGRSTLGCEAPAAPSAAALRASGERAREGAGGC